MRQFRFFGAFYSIFIVALFLSGSVTVEAGVRSYLLNDVPSFWGKVWADATRYVYEKSPEFWDQVNRIGAPVKKAVDHFEVSQLTKIAQGEGSSKIRKNLPESFQKQLDYLGESMKPGKDPALQARAEEVLESIRSAAEDWSMIDCYNVIVTDSFNINAFNTGCTIFVTSRLMKLLPEDRHLRAVLAHEMAHGDEGHLIKNFGLLGKALGKHLVEILKEDYQYLTTGKVGPHLRKAIEKDGSNHVQAAASAALSSVMGRYAGYAVDVEFEADLGGVRILETAGYSADDLIEALTVIHCQSVEDEYEDRVAHESGTPGFDPEKIRQEVMDLYIGGNSRKTRQTKKSNSEAIREYPTLTERVRKIQAHRKH